jgi:hypothetical protein
MKGGHTPSTALLHEDTDAELLVRRELLSVSADETTELIGHMSDRHVRADESHRHSTAPLYFSPRTVTRSASGVYMRVAAFASCLLKPSVISTIMLRMACSSSRVLELCALPAIVNVSAKPTAAASKDDAATGARRLLAA